MRFLNIAGYKFIALSHLKMLQQEFQIIGTRLALKGTIILSKEGININLAGLASEVMEFKNLLKKKSEFADIDLKESFSEKIPFKKFKIKIKKEIITLRMPTIDPSLEKGPVISAEEFKRWLDEDRDITVLDTRNDYEIKYGKFENGIHLNLKHFTDFPKAAAKLNTHKPIVMYCTGGIRCEKASLYLLKNGHREVYQLEGGILSYFEKIGGKHYQGDCYVFDERIAVNPLLKKTHHLQCANCSAPVTIESPENEIKNIYFCQICAQQKD